MKGDPILEYHELPRREIERLARLDEREACAKICDRLAGNRDDFTSEYRRGAGRCAADIRARGVPPVTPQA
jgi:hypothetical protein